MIYILREVLVPPAGTYGHHGGALPSSEDRGMLIDGIPMLSGRCPGEVKNRVAKEEKGSHGARRRYPKDPLAVFPRIIIHYNIELRSLSPRGSDKPRGKVLTDETGMNVFRIECGCTAA